MHDDLRRKMAAGYSGKESPTLEPDVDDCVRNLINLLERKYDSTGPTRSFDLAPKISFFTVDTIGKLAFDFNFKDLRDDNVGQTLLKQSSVSRADVRVGQLWLYRGSRDDTQEYIRRCYYTRIP